MNDKTITIDKKLYEKLLDKDKESELIFNNMLNGFALYRVLYDEDGKAVDIYYVSTNPAFTSVTGIPNPIGKTIKGLHPGISQCWIDFFQNIVKDGQPVREQKFCEVTLRWFDIVAFKVKEEEVAVFFTDISEFIETEQKAEKSLRLNKMLLDALPHPAMLINKNRIILAANERAKNMGAFVGEKCFNGFSTCKSICRNTDDCCFCKRGLDINDMDAKNLEIEAYGRIWDAWWKPVGNNSFLHYSIDITDIRRGEQTLLESAKELEASNQELEQFAYVASHDLQEPLRVVSSYCQMIEMFVEKNCTADMSADKKKDLKRYIDFTQDATRRMSFLIKDLLEFSRVGRADDNYDMIDINEIVKNVVKDFDVAIEENEAVVEYSEMPTLMIKRKRIGQVFHNLISNAIKFRSERDVIISINAEERKKDWLFSICDTGIGIEEKQHERIFGIFKRLHTREAYPGTGIGLALVKKIVESHGGEIWIESEKGEGSTFLFTIPKSWEIVKARK